MTCPAKIPEPADCARCRPDALPEISAFAPCHYGTAIPAALQQMLLYVRQHYGEKITIHDLASAARVSRHVCYCLFQAYLHTTPADYLNEYRLSAACRMLVQTRLSVREISSACGMNQSYFTQMFRLAVGCTPLEYRRCRLRAQ